MSDWDIEKDPTIFTFDFDSSAHLIDQINETLDEYADDGIDVDAIYHELIAREDEDEKITIDADEYWEIVKKHSSRYDWQPGDYGELRVELGQDKILYFRIEDDHGTLTPSYDLHDGLNYYSTRNSEHWPMIEQYVPRREWIDEIDAGARFVGRECTPDPQVREFFDNFLDTWIEGFRETHDSEQWGMSFEEWAADKRSEVSYEAEVNAREIERKQANREANAPKKKAEETITVYSVDSCQGCRMTAQMLEKAGIPFQVVDLSQRPDLVEQFRAEGLIQAEGVRLSV